MQRPPVQKQTHLPYSKWSQHRADNGLIYLAHPVTGEVKWLWSRHHDPKTGHDYLVNTITGKRQWVTKENEHFCPVKANPKSKSVGDSKTDATSNTARNTISDTARQKSAFDGFRRPPGEGSFVKMPATPAKVASKPNQDSAGPQPKFREIAAPKSLGLTADEVLMFVPETNRRYVYNKKTKTSRWLPERAIDTISAERKTSSLFGRLKGSKENASLLNTDDDIDPELKRKTQVPISFTTPERSIPGPNTTDHSRTPIIMNPGDHHKSSAVPRQTGQAFSHTNGFIKGAKNSAVRAGDENGNEVDEVTRRIGALNSILADATKLTTSEKYDLAKLRTVAKERSSKEEVQEGSQRLLELEEYLTQQMLRVDAVESEGNQVIRAKRKETVKAILALTEEIERLRKDLSS